MKYDELASGLVVPQPPKQPQRRLCPTEVSDMERRERVAKLLVDLWDAAGLKLSSCGIVTSDMECQEHRRAVWRLLAETLLGSDAPECEEYT